MVAGVVVIYLSRLGARCTPMKELHEYPGFFASRRNYDVAQGVDNEGQWRSGVLEASWRSGGPSTAELMALGALVQSPGLQVVEASAVKGIWKGSQRSAGSDSPLSGR